MEAMIRLQSIVKRYRNAGHCGAGKWKHFRTCAKWRRPWHRRPGAIVTRRTCLR